MVDHKIKADFNAMSVAELKKYMYKIFNLYNLYKNGDFSERILETSLVEITSAVEKIVLPVDPNFEKATPLP